MGKNAEPTSLLGWLKGHTDLDDRQVEESFSAEFLATLKSSSPSDINKDSLGRLYAIYYYKQNLTIAELNKALDDVSADFKTAEFYRALNAKLRYYNIERIKQELTFNNFTDVEKQHAAEFITELNHPEKAYSALFNFKNSNNSHVNMNILFNWIDLSIKDPYQIFAAYSSLYEVNPEFNRESKRWQKIKKINEEKDSYVKWILPASAWLGGFFVLEMILGIMNHLFYDSSGYMGIGEISDFHFSVIGVPIIFVVSIVFGYLMYNLNYSSCKAGTHAHHLERIASKPENFNFERTDAPNKLGSFYYYSTRACMMLLPLFSVLGILSMFELILFDIAKVNNPLEKISVPAFFYEAVGFIPIIPLVAGLLCVAGLYYESTRNAHGTYRATSLLTAGLLVSSFMAVMPLFELEYSALTFLYGTIIMICALFFTEAHNNEAQDTLRCSDQTQLDMREMESLSSGITVTNSFLSLTNRSFIGNQESNLGSDTEIETRPRSKSFP